MNRQNQDRADKVAHVYKKGRKVRGADEVLKRALADCMQEEAQQTQPEDDGADEGDEQGGDQGECGSHGRAFQLVTLS